MEEFAVDNSHCEELNCPDYKLCAFLVTLGRNDLCMLRYVQVEGEGLVREVVEYYRTGVDYDFK